MEVVPALDAGAMVVKGHVSILPTDTTQSLHDALSLLGAQLMVDAIATLERDGKLPSTPQDEALVTYAHKLEKSESAIDWHQSSEVLSRQIRAFNPFPVASSSFRGEVCKIWYATHRPDTSTKAHPGEIVGLGAQLTVACGVGLIDIAELQMPGGKRQTAQQFIQGRHVQLGESFA